MSRKLREIDLHLTNRCNLTCAHCSVDSGPGRSRYTEMAAARWAEVIEDAAALGCERCDFTGGEPVLYPAVEHLIGHALLRGMRVELQSNGILLSRERLERLRTAGLQTLVISLDGAASRHDRIRGLAGAHAHAVTAIREAVRTGFGVRVTCVVVTRAGLSNFPQFASELGSLGIQHLSVNLFSPVTAAHFVQLDAVDGAAWLRFTDTIEETARQAGFPISYEVAFARPQEIEEYLGEETRCLIERRRWFLIRSDGEVFPCYHFVHSGGMSLGNVQEQPLRALVADGNVSWRAYGGLGEVPQVCRSCDYSGTCGGGCPSPGYLRFGSLAVKDFRCAVERGFLPVCPFIKRTAGTRHMTNISPYYAVGPA